MALKNLLQLLIFSLVSSTVFGQDFNRPTPVGFPKYEFRKLGASSTDGYYLMSPLLPTQQSPIRNLAVLDDNGFLAWTTGNQQSFYTNFEYHPNSELFTFASNANPTSTVKFYVMDSTFHIVDSIAPENGAQTDIHEFRILDNGNYLITGTTQTIEDLSAYAFDGIQGSPQTNVLSFVIQEFQDGNLVFDWRSIDHIHPTEFVDETYNYGPALFDYVHGNAIEVDTDGNFLVSMRHTNAIYKVNSTTGDVIWTMGGNSSQFECSNDDWFTGQHDIRLLPNGNFTLFDNGNGKPAPRVSRAVEYEIDFTDSTVTPVWEYTNEYNSYSRAMGSFRVDDNGEKMIGFGFCYRPVPNFVHLDHQDQVISEMLFQDSVISYRALRADFPFELNRPEITCSVVNNETILTAPSGSTTYRWNTGEDSQTISVNELGTYQVWIDHGIGQIGSIPFEVSDLSNPCGLVSTNEPALSASDLIKSTGINGVYEIQSAGAVSVCNSLGQSVFNGQLNGFERLDLTNQPAGVYLVTLTTNNQQRVSSRVVKF